MARRVLFVLPTGTYRAGAFLSAAAKLQLEVVVATEEPSTLGWKHPESEVVVDLDRPDDVAEAVAHLNRGSGWRRWWRWTRLRSWWPLT